MLRFANLLIEGMSSRGHHIDCWTAPVVLGRYGNSWPALQKWLGYLDQFVVFPILLRLRLFRLPPETIFVFCDQALGPWVPLVAHRPHIIYCHDFLALRGAIGELPQHCVGWSGQLYQKLIRWGFCHGLCFISISAATQQDLHRFLSHSPALSEVVYNPLNADFSRIETSEVDLILRQDFPQICNRRFLLHIGQNWYKNRLGVLEVFDNLAKIYSDLQLVFIGNLEPPLKNWLEIRPYLLNKITIIDKISFLQLRALYNRAQLLLFPSLFEGFGWPILEAMACGCPVVTTGEPPMTEVGDEIAYYIQRRPDDHQSSVQWAQLAALKVQQLLELPVLELESLRQRGIQHCSRFNRQETFEQYEYYYQKALTIGSLR